MLSFLSDISQAQYDEPFQRKSLNYSTAEEFQTQVISWLSEIFFDSKPITETTAMHLYTVQAECNYKYMNISEVFLLIVEKVKDICKSIAGTMEKCYYDMLMTKDNLTDLKPPQSEWNKNYLYFTEKLKISNITPICYVLANIFHNIFDYISAMVRECLELWHILYEFVDKSEKQHTEKQKFEIILYKTILEELFDQHKVLNLEGIVPLLPKEMKRNFIYCGIAGFEDRLLLTKFDKNEYSSDCTCRINHQEHDFEERSSSMWKLLKEYSENQINVSQEPFLESISDLIIDIEQELEKRMVLFEKAKKTQISSFDLGDSFRKQYAPNYFDLNRPITSFFQYISIPTKRKISDGHQFSDQSQVECEDEELFQQYKSTPSKIWEKQLIEYRQKQRRFCFSRMTEENYAKRQYIRRNKRELYQRQMEKLRKKKREKYLNRQKQYFTYMIENHLEEILEEVKCEDKFKEDDEESEYNTQNSVYFNNSSSVDLQRQFTKVDFKIDTEILNWLTTVKQKNSLKLNYQDLEFYNFQKRRQLVDCDQSIEQISNPRPSASFQQMTEQVEQTEQQEVKKKKKHKKKKKLVALDETENTLKHAISESHDQIKKPTCDQSDPQENQLLSFLQHLFIEDSTRVPCNIDDSYKEKWLKKAFDISTSKINFQKENLNALNEIGKAKKSKKKVKAK